MWEWMLCPENTLDPGRDSIVGMDALFSNALDHGRQ